MGSILTGVRQLSVAVAMGGVIHNHATGLHEGITNGRSDEREAGFFQAFAHGFCLRSNGRKLMAFSEVVDPGFAPHKRPQILDRISQRQPGPGITPCPGDFQAVADDPRIEHQRLDFGVSHGCQSLHIKAEHDLAIMLAFTQNSDPGQTGLEPFEQ